MSGGKGGRELVTFSFTLLNNTISLSIRTLINLGLFSSGTRILRIVEMGT